MTDAMSNKISKRFTIIYDFTINNFTQQMSITMCADTEEQARKEFDEATAERSKHRSGTRKITSIEFKQANPTYLAAEDFANRYGVDPIQYEEE